VSPSRRFHLTLPPELEAEATAFGRAAGVGLGPAIRLLVASGLAAEAEPARPASIDPSALLATLTAAEHAVLMVASILPEGEQRMRSLAPRAAQSAEERLALFREQPAAPEEHGQ